LTTPRRHWVLTSKPPGFTAVGRSKLVVFLAELLAHTEILILFGPSVPVLPYPSSVQVPTHPFSIRIAATPSQT
jgi:hypothetical protein